MLTLNWLKNEDNVVYGTDEELIPMLSKELLMPDFGKKIAQFREAPVKEGVTLKGGTSEFEVNGQVYKPHYNAMHYSLYSWKTEEWNHFNQATPLSREANDWGISMTRTKATVSKDRTPVHTKNYLRKTQPRVHVEGRKLTR